VSRRGKEKFVGRAKKAKKKREVVEYNLSKVLSRNSDEDSPDKKITPTNSPERKPKYGEPRAITLGYGFPFIERGDLSGGALQETPPARRDYLRRPKSVDGGGGGADDSINLNMTGSAFENS